MTVVKINGRQNKFWRDLKNVDKLIALTAIGHSAAQISAAFDNAVSRDAVISKQRQLRKIAIMSASPTSSLSLSSKSSPTLSPVDKHVYIPKQGAFEPLPGSKPIKIMKLRTSTCHWPIDGKPVRYCGLPTGGEVYCTTHTRMGSNGYGRKGIPAAPASTTASSITPLSAPSSPSSATPSPTTEDLISSAPTPSSTPPSLPTPSPPFPPMSEDFENVE